ncbi:MAG: hypothetical protein HY923_04465 [Elusimicrobia bacterium]|nr:hypothetical protein [Elusimicrobiota bacterium]
MKRAALFMALLLLQSCVAETVERRRPRKGPIKEVGFVDLGGGQVRYSTDGWPWFVSGRRRHALRLMRKNCGKDLSPQVLDEYQHQDSDIAYAGEDISTNLGTGMDHFKIAPFQHMKYECRPKGAPVEVIKVSSGSPVMVIPPVSVSTSSLIPGATQ